MQVSDLALFATVKKKWYSQLSGRLGSQAAQLALRVNEDDLTRENFWERLRPAWDAATTPDRVKKGFELAGQWPVNPDRVLRQIASINHDKAAPIVPAALDQQLFDRTNLAEKLALKQELRSLKKQLKLVNRENERLRTQAATSINLANFDATTTEDGSIQLTTDIDIEEELAAIESGPSDTSPSLAVRLIEVHETATPSRHPNAAAARTARQTANDLYPMNMADPQRLLDEQTARDDFASQAAHRAVSITSTKPC